jgi:PKD repeat protein
MFFSFPSRRRSTAAATPPLVGHRDTAVAWRHLLLAALVFLFLSADRVAAQSCTPTCPPQDFCCGNCICDPGEDRLSCPDDCRVGCNFDGLCEPVAHENQENCPSDCPPETPACGNGIPEPGEDCSTCPGDVALKPTFTASPPTAQVGQAIAFTASGIMEPPTPQWDMGNAVHLTGNPLTYSYPTAGTFNVVLTASEANCGLTRLSDPVRVTIGGVPPNNQAPTANAGGPYEGRVLDALLLNGSGSTDADGDDTITSFVWDFGDRTSASGKVVVHAYLSQGTYVVALTVRDNGGLTDRATTSAAVAPASFSGRFHTSQGLTYYSSFNDLQAFANMTILPPDSFVARPVLRAVVYDPQNRPTDLGFIEGQFTRTFRVPTPGVWRMKVDYYFANITDPSNRVLVDSRESITSVSVPPPSGPPPRIGGPTALWFFNGQFGDPSHPTSINLSVAPGGSTCAWSIERGSDKVMLQTSGCFSATVTSARASTLRDDVVIRVDVDGRRSDPHRVTVFRPYRLYPLGAPSDSALSGGWQTYITYEIDDQFYGRVRGVSVREVFLGQVVDWPGPVNWNLPTAGAFFAANGEFADRMFIYGCTLQSCTPMPASPFDPTAAQRVRHLNQEWWVGNVGFVRVQSNWQQWYLGFGRHESVMSPVP